MANSSSPKQDTFNPSLMSALFTQQKSWTHFEAQLTKPNAMLTCRPMKRHLCVTEVPLCTLERQQHHERELCGAGFICKAAEPHEELCWGRDQPPPPALQAHFPKAHAWESVRLSLSIQLLKGTVLDFPVLKNEFKSLRSSVLSVFQQSC